MHLHEIPSHEEYFGLVDNIISDEEFDYDNSDEETKKLIILCLSLLQEFYIEFMYSDEYVIASEEFKERIDSFSEELKDYIFYLFGQYIESVHFNLSMEYEMPLITLEKQMLDLKRDIENTISSSIDAIVQTLYYDLKDKADFYKEMATVTGVFSLHSNFRRAIRKLKNTLEFKSHYAYARAERSHLEFVYGQDALFQWNCTGVNTCEWCYSIAELGAMPLSYFPVDHINGRCWLTPVHPDKYSDEYNQLRGW